jgi:hypothetical protein
MSCVDPQTARRALDEAPADPGALRRHLDACSECRAGLGGTDEHPAALLIVQCDEEPASVEPSVREWVARHLAICGPCAEALREVSALSAPAEARPRDRRWWVTLAAAGWLFAAILGFELLYHTDGSRVAQPEAIPVVLSAQRDGVAKIVSPGTNLLLLTFVFAEEIQPGQDLKLRLEDAAGVVGLWRRFRVERLGQWGWPQIRVSGSELPRGRSLIHVRTPSGQEASFALQIE